MTELTNRIWVTFQVPAIHCFPGAANCSALHEVDYLAYPHRHVFYFKVYLDVTHNDRDVEFILFKNDLQGFVKSWGPNWGTRSCEMAADLVADYIGKKYPNRNCAVSVSEDNENGCVKTYKSN